MRNRRGAESTIKWLAGITILTIGVWVSVPLSTAQDSGEPARGEDATDPLPGSQIESVAEALRMEEYVRNFVDREAVRETITTEFGDVVDCVDIYRQPALRQPGMEDHIVQFAPTTWPQDSELTDSAADQSAGKDVQVTTLETVQCPIGTVPILRLTMDTLRNFKNLDDFRKKIPSHILDPRVGSTNLHQYAHAWRSVQNWGAESVLNLWSPYVERSNEFSLSQIWVTRGSGSYLETVEGGWQVYKNLYGDWRARLFIYFTPDAYGPRGCYNLTCGAFVQTDSSIYIGGPFANYSQYGGSQYVIKLLWYKDGTNGSWWLRYNDKWVGYYPRSLFDSNGLRDRASYIDFGGEIINQRTNGRHTYTDMGSGRFPRDGFSYAAYQRSLRYVDTSNYYRAATGLTASRTDSWCYDISLGSSTGTWGQYFYFGGPGYNTNCQ